MKMQKIVKRPQALLVGFVPMAQNSLKRIDSSLNSWLYRIVAFVGLAAVFLSLKKSWFTVPLASNGFSGGAVADAHPACTPWFQALLFILAVFFVVSWIRKREWSVASTCLACLICFLPLVYPYFVMVRSPLIAAEATWLQMQHDNLTWLGGDVYANAEFGSMGWRSKTYLVDAPRQLAVINLPSWSPWEFGFHRLNDLIQWLGFSNAFCQFTDRGWGLAIFGGVMLLLASFQRKGYLVLQRIGVASVFFVMAASGMALVAWSFPFQASRQIRLASVCCSEGDYESSLLHLNQAVELLPVLGQDTYYVAQRGILEQRLFRDSQYAALQRAYGLERDAQYDQAYAILERLVESPNPAIKRESLRGVLRYAIQDYNCARFELSSQRFMKVLEHHPCDVKTIYLMQLQGIRESRLDQVKRMRDRMYEATGYLNFGTRKVLRAAAQQHVATAVGLSDNANAIWMAQSEAKDP